LIKEYDIIFLSESRISKNTAVNLNIDVFYSDHLFGNKSRYAHRGRYSGDISVYFKQFLGNDIKIVEKIKMDLYG
jgi:hypothetical protein